MSCFKAYLDTDITAHAHVTATDFALCQELFGILLCVSLEVLLAVVARGVGTLAWSSASLCWLFRLPIEVNLTALAHKGVGSLWLLLDILGEVVVNLLSSLCMLRISWNIFGATSTI